MRHLTLAAALDGAGLTAGEQMLGPVRAAERSGLDFITLGDSHWPAAGGEGRLDAIMAAAWLAPQTQTIGLVPVATTTLTEPFLLSTQIASLDFASRGRAGWLVAVPDLPGDGGYVGPRAVARGEAAFAEALEHVEVVRRLWDSWEDDAEVRDVERHRFIDRERIHHIDFRGTHLSVKGPSITPRPPQGQPPVVAQIAERAEPELRLAAAVADVILIGPEIKPGAIREAVASAGRDPHLVRVLADFDARPSNDAAALIESLRDLLGDADLDGARLVGAEPGVLPQLVAGIRGGADDRRLATLRARLGWERPPNRYAAAETATIPRVTP